MGRNVSVNSAGKMVERRTNPDSGVKKFALDMLGETGAHFQQQAQLQQMQQLMCEVTGGTWDAKAGTCIPKENPYEQMFGGSSGVGGIGTGMDPELLPPIPPDPRKV
jgi:hypothetical protein